MQPTSLVTRSACALRIALLCGCLALSGCSSPPRAEAPAARATGIAPDALDMRAAVLPSQDGTVFQLDPALSSVRIYAFRAGAGRRFGHNHVLSAPTFTGYFFLPAQDPDGARFALEFALDALELDKPEHRAALGESFAKPLGPDVIASTREHMLGEFNLQADRFPWVRIASLQIAGEAPKFQAKIRVELHGERQDLWVPITVRGLPNSLTAEGAFVLSQSDFGIRPYAVLGGLLAVQDQLMVEFKLQGAPQNGKMQ